MPGTPFRESAIVRLATNRFSTRRTKGSEGSTEDGVGASFTRLGTNDDSPVVNASGNSEVSSLGDKGGTAEGESLAVEDVVWERRVLCEGGTAGLLRAVDCRPLERWGGGKMMDSDLEGEVSEGGLQMYVLR